MSPGLSRDILEDLYARYNDRRFAHPDPIEFLYRYDDPGEREVVGLVASCLSYGNVTSILSSVESVLGRLGSPLRAVCEDSPARLRERLVGFKHRWTTGEEVASLICGIGGVTEWCGSLQACFLEGLRPEEETLVPALARLVDRIYAHAPGPPPRTLLPLPLRGSASKRLHLFLRWMVRRDGIDPGGWDSVSPSKLLVPLDTHMHRIGLALRWTRRKQGGLRAALDVTRALGRYTPGDPVKYDFALTRLGIRPEADLAGFLRSCGVRRWGL